MIKRLVLKELLHGSRPRRHDPLVRLPLEGADQRVGDRPFLFYGPLDDEPLPERMPDGVDPDELDIEVFYPDFTAEKEATLGCSGSLVELKKTTL